MKLATVVFLKKEDKIILAKKKQHIHVGEEKLDKSKETYNGYGGKFEVDTDKDIEDTAIRELDEESGGVKGDKKDLVKIGEVEFFWPNNNTNDPNMFVSFYIIDKYIGSPIETDEMYSPEEFLEKDIPYGFMMGADKEIIPKMFENKSGFLKFKVHHFENSEYKIEEVREIAKEIKRNINNGLKLR